MHHKIFIFQSGFCKFFVLDLFLSKYIEIYSEDTISFEENPI